MSYEVVSRERLIELLSSGSLKANTGYTFPDLRAVEETSSYADHVCKNRKQWFVLYRKQTPGKTQYGETVGDLFFEGREPQLELDPILNGGKKHDIKLLETFGGGTKTFVTVGDPSFHLIAVYKGQEAS